MNMQQIREQYPQYDDLSDQALADALYEKYYSDMDRAAYDDKIGLKASGPSYGTGLAREALQGLSLGWADEAGLGAAALAGSLTTGEPLSEVYRQMRTQYDAEQKQFKQENPKASFTAELAGSVGTGGLGATKAMAAGVPKLAALAGTGALGGGLYGAGTADDRVSGGLQGAAIGGLAAPALGLAGGKIADTVAKSNMMKSIRAASPSKDSIAEASNKLYAQAKKSGIVIKEDSYQDLVQQVGRELKPLGFDPTIHPKVSAAVRRFAEHEGPIDIGEVDNLRRIMGAAARSNEADERRIGVRLMEILDDRLDTLTPDDVISGDAESVGKVLKNARNLWSRKRRLDMIEDAFDKAKNQASGLENGIRIQFRQILNNPKKRRGFSKDEIALMNRVVQGGKMENALKLAGKLGFSENQASQLLGTATGIAGGAAVGGPIGAVMVPVLGQASKNAAQRMTRTNADNVAAAVARGITPESIYRQVLANPQAAYGLLDDPQIARSIADAASRQRMGLLGLGSGLGVSLGGEP